MRKEIETVVSQSSRKLYQISSPPVRYWLLIDVMQKEPDDPLVLKTVEECASYPPRVRLLAKLRENGTWPISKAKKTVEDAGPGPPYGWTYITMLRNVQMLGDACTSIEEGHMRAVPEKILSWQAHDGHIPGPWGRFPLPHYNGYAVRNLLMLGYEGDPRVKKLVSWVIKQQRHDGGWIIPYLQDSRYLPEYRNMKVSNFLALANEGKIRRLPESNSRDIPSCLWTTMMVVRGMTHSKSLVSSKVARRGADFFLDGFFKKNYHPTFFQEASHWTKLKFPTHFGSGLCALDILTYMGYGVEDERLEKPMKWLLGARQRDGFWSQSHRPHGDKDQWITEIALAILARYARSY